MKNIRYLLLIVILMSPHGLFSQDAEKIRPEEVDKKKQEQKSPAEPDEAGKNAGLHKMNLDAIMLYGQYNRIFWSGSITQSFKAFTYQLNSNFKRSNDFGYKNSRYYQNEIGFTGEADATDRWRITPEIEVNNNSFGMFRNPFYSREEKDRVTVRFKNDYKPMPTRWTFNAGGTYFVHRLDSSLYPSKIQIQPYHSSDFYKANVEIGWQYIWSAANKLSFNSKCAYYFYSRAPDNDTWVTNEFIWNFNISEYFKFGVGPLYTYNRDRGHFPSGKLNVATTNIKYLSIDASYMYELAPFTPEDFYFNQRYVRPVYSLAPGRGHHVDLAVGVNVTNSSDQAAYLKNFKFKASGSFITNDRYYSYFSLAEQVLTPHQMNVVQARARCDAVIAWAIYSSTLELGGKYEYSYFYASGYVTYQPEHLVNAYIRITVDRVETEFGTGYRDKMYISPFYGKTMRPALTGYLTLQVRIFDSLYLYGRIDNIYNRKYSTVYGYPEPGRTVIGGLRIII